MNDRKELDSIAQARELWPVLVHRKWIILLASVLLSATAIVAICLLPDWYEATITMLVDPQKIADRYAGSDSVTMDQLRFDTLTQQVLSTARLHQVIDELQLYPELRGCMRPDEVVQYMKKFVTVQVRPGGDRNAGTFTIGYKGKDPKVVARVVAWLADRFVEWNLAARQHQAEGASEFVSDQLAEAKKNLDEEESKLNQFKTQYLSELPEQMQPNAAALSRLQVGLQANADALNRLDMEKALLTQPSSLTSGTVVVDSECGRLAEEKRKLEQDIRELRSRYSDEYPEVIRANQRLDWLRQRLSNLPDTDQKAGASPVDPRLATLNREIRRTQEEKRGLIAEIAKYQAYVERAPLREQQLSDLSRNYQAAKVHYSVQMEKQYAAGVSVDLERKREAERFSVLEPATVPDKPIKPHRKIMILAVVPLCFLFSAGAAIISERFRGSISTENKLRRLLPDSIPVVGRIPRIPTQAYIIRQRQWATFSIITSLLCCMAVAFVVWKVHPHF